MRIALTLGLLALAACCAHEKNAPETAVEVHDAIVTDPVPPSPGGAKDGKERGSPAHPDGDAPCSDPCTRE